MPTGYTATLAEGEQSFQDFALSCARAFGACIEQRDDPMTDKPKLAKKSNYHDEQLEKAKTELAAFDAWTTEQKLAYGEKAKAEDIESSERSLAKKRAQQARYEGMVAQVSAWEPPSADHVEYKKFMLQQLSSSIEFDCGGSYYEQSLERARKKDPLSYTMEYRETLTRNIEYHEAESKKEDERHDGRNEWITKLYKSLDLEVPGV